MDLTSKIVQVANSYIGQTEKPNNGGFLDPVFQKDMETISHFHKGDPWCADSAKLIWVKAFTEIEPDAIPLLNKYFSPSTLETYHNFKASPEFAVRMEPKEGGVILFQHGSSQQGHTGICTKVIDEHTILDAEGNTNDDGSREGTTELNKKRILNLPHSEHALNYLGCVYPIRIK